MSRPLCPTQLGSASTCLVAIVHPRCCTVAIPLAPLASGALTFVLQVMIYVCSFLVLALCVLTAAAVPIRVHSTIDYLHLHCWPVTDGAATWSVQ